MHNKVVFIFALRHFAMHTSFHVKDCSFVGFSSNKVFVVLMISFSLFLTNNQRPQRIQTILFDIGVSFRLRIFEFHGFFFFIYLCFSSRLLLTTNTGIAMTFCIFFFLFLRLHLQLPELY